MLYSLSNLKKGEKAIVKKISLPQDRINRFSDIGLILDTIVECVGVSPFGDPKAYKIKGAVIAIRNSDCKNIFVYKENFYGSSV